MEHSEIRDGSAGGSLNPRIALRSIRATHLTNNWENTAMRTITLEEHFTTPKFLEGPGRARQQKAQQQGGRFIKIFEQLADVGPGRWPTWMPPASICRCCR